jgi:hypothetical protein
VDRNNLRRPSLRSPILIANRLTDSHRKEELCHGYLIKDLLSDALQIVPFRPRRTKQSNRLFDN